MLRVGFQGSRGAYSELACIKYFGKNAKLVGYKTLPEIFYSIKKREITHGVLPIENSTTGSINETYDLLLTNDAYIVGEILLKIEHCLIAKNNSTLKDIKKVYSHPQALDQCKKFIEQNKFEPISTWDTAGSAEIIKKSKSNDKAIIASELVSKIYNLKILKKNISSGRNITRFVVISKNQSKNDNKKEMKTSLVFRTKHKPGALVNCLFGFKEHKINLTKIESRPIKNKPWEYSFYLDFDGDIKEDNSLKKALKKLKKNSSFLKILGSYPKGYQ